MQPDIGQEPPGRASMSRIQGSPTALAMISTAGTLEWQAPGHHLEACSHDMDSRRAAASTALCQAYRSKQAVSTILQCLQP